MARILILTEAGSGIGFGHLTRMQALAYSLRRSGAVVEMRVDPGAPTDTRLPGVPWRRWRDAKSASFDVAVVDSYRASHAQYRLARQMSGRLVAIDDYNRLDYEADLIVNPGLHGEELYSSAQTCPVMAGPRYILLRPAFVSHPPQHRAKGPPVVLVTVGGEDPHALLAPLALSAFEITGEVELLTGDENKKREFRSRLPGGIHIHGRLGAVAMRNLIDRCNIAITAAGQTMHELSCRRIAMVAVLTGDDQRYNLSGYAKAGALIRPLRFDDKHLTATVARDLNTLLDPQERTRRTRAAAKLVDGRGAQRVAHAILRLLSAYA